MSRRRMGKSPSASLNKRNTHPMSSLVRGFGSVVKHSTVWSIEKKPIYLYKVMEEHHDLHEEVLEVGCHGELGDVVVVVGVGHLAEDV